MSNFDAEDFDDFLKKVDEVSGFENSILTRGLWQAAESSAGLQSHKVAGARGREICTCFVTQFILMLVSKCRLRSS